MTSATTVMSESQPQKFSRYRSVRKTATAIVPEDAPPVPDTEPVSLNRAPSRYRHAKRSGVQDVPPMPAIPAAQPIPQHPQEAAAVAYRNRSATDASPALANSPPARYKRVRRSHDGQNHESAGNSEQAEHNFTTSRKNHQRDLSRAASFSSRPATAVSRSYEAAREEARMILEGEYDRLQKVKEIQKQNEKELKAKQAKTKSPPREPPIEENVVADVNDAAARHKQHKFFDAPKHQVQRRPTLAEKQKYIPAPQNMIREQMPKPRTSEDVAAIAPVQPQFDAPKSAVNAGERRVEVRCSGASTGITLPVTPTTSARDLLNSASIVMSDSFDPRTAILVESFSQVGLERPLRRYEHVRDVMNSWDMDSQNFLVIMRETECAATGLEKKEAPVSIRSEVALQLHHSSKLGKWDKRWVALKPDGQVTISKNETDSDGINICHVSDFDVYTPTRKQIKKLKSPKKICIAVKSQQKSAMFLEGTNFVHFFATGERDVADCWYNAIQSWRSWYLVNVLGEGVQPKENKEVRTIAGVGADARPGTANSQDTIPYQLGSFQPLLDFDVMAFSLPDDADVAGVPPKGQSKTHSNKPSLDFSGSRPSMDHRRSVDVQGDGGRRGARQARVPPSAFPTKLLAGARNRVELGLDSDEQAFTGGGLLGRSATRRSQNGRGPAHNVPDGPDKPLVEWAGQSEFADGSLLSKLEAWTVSQGDHQPKVDRQKRIEANVRVGEGV